MNQSRFLKLDSIWKKGREFLGTEFPIMGGAMTWVSEKNLVSAISNAGGFGVLACGGMNVKELESEIIETSKMTNKPFGVNLILMHPEIDDLINTCILNDVKFVVFAGGFPKKSQIEILKKKKYKDISLCNDFIYCKKNDK